MDEKAVKVIAEYEFKTNEKLVKEFDSLKPKAYRGLISLVIFVMSLFVYEYFIDSSLFENGGYLLFLAIVISSGLVEAESHRINKRIDILVKLIKSGSIKQENS
ncbi:MAG: hypothetical protein ACPGJI_00230 [Kangiellaceae bacterium]